MNRRVWMLAVGLMAVGCGETVRPIGFSSATKPLAQSLQAAVKKKDVKQIEAVLKTAKDRAASDKLRQAELSIFEAVQKHAEKQEWEPAEKLLTDSLAIQVKS